LSFSFVTHSKKRNLIALYYSLMQNSRLAWLCGFETSKYAHFKVLDSISSCANNYSVGSVRTELCSSYFNRDDLAKGWWNWFVGL